MRRLRAPSSAIAPYLMALIAAILTTIVLLVFRNDLSSPIIALLYLLPVVLSTTLWGLGPGIMVAFCAFLAFNYFFIPPYFTLAVHQTQDVLALAVFLIVAVVISQLLGRSRTATAAARLREREATRLYELSTALAGQHEDQAIARTIAEHALETFQAECIELSVKRRAVPDSVTVRVPDRPAPSDKPLRVYPLQTARGLQGEIGVWRGEEMTHAADRLMRTFASQGALALERAHLSIIETRAKVLEESDRLKSALLSSVSHELRSPLAAITAGVTSLRSGEVGRDSPAGQDLLSVIEEESDHLNRLVGNLLDMSRIEAGALNPQRQWNTLADIVGGTLAHMRHASDRHHVEIDLPDDLPLVPLDPAQLDQVFANLISNSLKYTPAGSTVYIGARAGDGGPLLVEVRNQGPRVADEHLDRIFDKFYRVTAADRVTGTGLGLSICKGIIEAHGGRIWAENLPDGLVFKFSLPLTWDGAAPPRLPPSEADA